MFEGKNVKVMLANAGAGKALSVDTIIPTPEGFKRFGDIKVGDYVYNADGKPTMVLGVYPQGKLEAYKVTFSDGRSTICNDEHLWGVYTRTGHSLKEWKYQVMTLKEMLEKGVRGVDRRKNRTCGTPKFYIPASPVCEGEVKTLPVDSYVLGSFIGNGCLTSDYLTLSSNDEWQVKKVADKLKCTYKRNKANYNWTFYRDGHLLRTDSIFPTYLCCKANDKFIPSDYLFASVKQRQELLQGLFDTDGSASNTDNRLNVTYSTVSKELAIDIRNILLSFGIVSSIREDKRKGNFCYCLRINASKEKKELLFYLPRKKSIVTSFTTVVRRDYTKVAIRSVEKLSDKVVMQCIYVGNEMHLFLCNDFIVTHNTNYLVNDITKELESRRPEEVAFVTFTRKGAEEGLHRICDKLMLEVEDLPYFRTLHSLTFHALNLKADQMFGRYDQRVFNKKYGYSVNRSEVNTGKVAPSKDSMYLDFYDMERSGALTTKQLVEADIEIGYYRQLVRNYEDFKREQHLVDFFDCLIKYVQTGSSLPCKVLYVDECQDISALQWKVIEKAFDKAEKIVLAGDDKQSIFEYSGARPDILIGLSKQFPTEHLAMSYRLPRRVFELANAITRFIGVKTEQKSIFREVNAEGSITQLNDIERLTNFIHNWDGKQRDVTEWYILTRNNCFLDKPKKLLEDNLIPYWTAEGFFMGGQVMKRIKDYEGYRCAGYRDDKKKEDFQRRFGIEDFSLPFTETNLFTENRKWVYASYIEKYGLEKLKEMCTWRPQILVSTVHHVKGGEARNVALMLDTTRRTQMNIQENLDEELHILYVAVTRARENLFLIDSSNGTGFDDIIQTVKEENNLKW